VPLVRVPANLFLSGYYGGFYAGNMWWADCRYINTLRRLRLPGEGEHLDRFGAEGERRGLGRSADKQRRAGRRSDIIACLQSAIGHRCLNRHGHGLRIVSLAATWMRSGLYSPLVLWLLCGRRSRE
jgi:hypothetical protein